VEFRHKYPEIPAPTSEDRIIQGLQQVAGVLTGATPPTSISQVDAIANLRDIFESWCLLAPPNLRSSAGPSQGLPRVHSHIAPIGAVSLPATPSPSCIPTPTRTPYLLAVAPQSIHQQAPTPGQATPRRLDFSDTPAQPIPRVPLVSPPATSYLPPTPPALLPVCEPISDCTCSRAQAPLALFTSGRPYHEQVKYPIPTAKATRPAEEPLAFAGLCESYHMKPAEVDAFAFHYEALTLEDEPGLLALLVLDPATDEFLEHRQLCWDPRYKTTWDTSYANELGRLCQGIGSGSTPLAQRVSGTNTLFLIDYHDIPLHKRKEVCHTMVVCEVRPDKDDLDCTRITIGGNRICFLGNVGTNTASLELVKLLLNSVLSWKGARFSSINLKNFYLDTPMPDPEYVRIKISDIPAEFIEEYNLTSKDWDGWIYIEICQRCYGLLQAGILADDLLRTRLEAEGYYKAATTPGLWRHKWRPIQLCLIVDDFGVD
jgi:hypothetical protein